MITTKTASTRLFKNALNEGVIFLIDSYLSSLNNSIISLKTNNLTFANYKW